jgi:acyl carrier protein
MNTQDHSAPNSPSRHQGNGVDSPRLRWMNAATSGLILAGLLAFFGLVAALFYLALEDLADQNIHLWYKALCYVLSGFTALSAVLVFLRFSLLPSRLKDNVTETESARLSRMDMAMGGLLVTELVALIALVTALAYFEWLDIVDPDISNFWNLAIWCAAAGMAALSAGLACLRFRLFLTLAWIVAACSPVLVISARLLMETARANVPSYNPFSVQAIVLSLLVVVTASLVWCLRKARQKPTRSGSVVFGATTFGSVAVTLFAIYIWGSSLGTPTSGSTEGSVIQATPPRPVTWEEVRTIIAEQLNVPEGRVTPGSRLREDLKAKNTDVAKITWALEDRSGIEGEPNDDEVILTAQDAFDFAQSPETFMDQAFRRH